MFLSAFAILFFRDFSRSPGTTFKQSTGFYMKTESTKAFFLTTPQFLCTLSSAGPRFRTFHAYPSTLVSHQAPVPVQQDSPITARSSAPYAHCPLPHNLEFSLVSHWNPHYSCTIPTSPIKSACLKQAPRRSIFKHGVPKVDLVSHTRAKSKWGSYCPPTP